MTKTTCEPCNEWVPPLEQDRIQELMKPLHADWTFDATGTKLARRFEFKGFAKATYMANLAAFLSDQQGHHADIAFGWGYCEVTYTSHELGRLSENDFICAKKLDALVA